jgi:hypothetical protein
MGKHMVTSPETEVDHGVPQLTIYVKSLQDSRRLVEMRRIMGKLGLLIFGGVSLMGLALLTIGLVAVVRFDPLSVLPQTMSP